MSRRRLAKLILPVAAVLALASAASAYLTTIGSGAGSGSVNVRLSAITVTGATATQSMLPTGSPTGDLNVTLNNGNSSSVHISSLALDTTQGSSGFSANAGGCALSFTTQNNGGSGWTIPANGMLPVDLTNSVTMGTTAATSCQGQSFNVHLKAS
jgi:hypothetical protein